VLLDASLLSLDTSLVTCSCDGCLVAEFAGRCGCGVGSWGEVDGLLADGAIGCLLCEACGVGMVQRSCGVNECVVCLMLEGFEPRQPLTRCWVRRVAGYVVSLPAWFCAVPAFLAVPAACWMSTWSLVCLGVEWLGLGVVGMRGSRWEGIVAV
jgi:hypothetical protein